MINFFVIVDTKGFIKEVKWTTSPDYIYEGQSLTSLLDESSASKVLKGLNKAFEQEDQEDQEDEEQEDMVEYDSFTLLFNTGEAITQMSLYLIGTEKNSIVLGVSGRSEEDPVIKEIIRAYNDIINRLREESKKYIKGYEEKTRQEYEEMHKLNNELNNTKREIKKANYRLENLNRELQEKLAKDPLTGLIGRYQFSVGIRSKIDSNPDKLGVFVFIDLDDFKIINDTYGHVAGDQFLIEVAKRLESIPLENCMRIRISGDEFGLFIYGYDNMEEVDLQKIWELIKEYVLQKPIYLNEKPIEVAISAGTVLYGIDTKDVEDMIEYADFAMYEAKRKGKNRCERYNQEDYDNRKVKKLQSEAVDQVIKEKDLQHVYQPIISAVDGSIFAYDALMRTENNFFADTPELIEYAFQESRYIELDNLSFKKLLKDNEGIDKFEDKLLFVPHGPYSLFRNKEINEKQKEFLKKQCVVELVNGQMASIEDIDQIMNDTRKIGCKAAISDFAAGRPNDLIFLTFEYDFVKISKKLTRGIDKDLRRQNIVKRIVSYAHSQGTKVIMEGIETKEELNTVTRLQVDYLQGYYLGVPQKELSKGKSDIKEEILKVTEANKIG